MRDWVLVSGEPVTGTQGVSTPLPSTGGTPATEWLPVSNWLTPRVSNQWLSVKENQLTANNQQLTISNPKFPDYFSIWGHQYYTSFDSEWFF
ncbi:hypothetical protein [Scytonema sp. PCC 10023]|uniref:hypothetical protein n=1 Tax=Scytonema sp. PCC 10023 TaxID=1680591 RepID=UPI0039C69DEA